MNVKKPSFGLIIISVLILGGCQTTETQEQAVGLAVIESETADIMESYFKTKLDDHERICSEINHPKTKNECYVMAASLKEDFKICEKIDTSRQFSALQQEECLATVAYATGNEELCKQVKNPDIRYGCFTGLAIHYEDRGYCDGMDNNIMKEDCLSLIAELKGDASICDELSLEEYQIGCLQHTAQSANNIELCSKIPGEREIEFFICRRGMLDKLWYRWQCLSLGYNFAREFCFDVRAKTADKLKELKDKTICDSILKRFDQRYDCYSDLAYSTGDLRACEEIPIDETSKWDFCIRASIIKGRNIENCKRIKAEEQRDLCMIDMAVALKNVSICDNMNSEDEEIVRNKCYEYVGISLNDVSICEKITILDDKVRCIKHIAKAMLNESLCKQIELSDMRDSCLTGLFQAQDNWDYDCAWESDWILMYTCTFAKKQGIADGMRKHGKLPK